MALPGKFSCYRLGSPGAKLTLEAYLDFCCPFSQRAYQVLTEIVLPYVDSQYPNQVQLIFRHQPQPWHPQSTIVHELAMAVAREEPEMFWRVCTVLFDQQSRWFDLNTYGKSRALLIEELAALIHERFERQADEEDLFEDDSDATQSETETETETGVGNNVQKELLSVRVQKLLSDKSTGAEGGEQNAGNEITNDFKWHLKLSRQNGIHVSPTILVDGLIENSISSSWAFEQWQQFFQSRLA